MNAPTATSSGETTFKTILWCGANSDIWNRVPLLISRGWKITVVAGRREVETVIRTSGGLVPDVRLDLIEEHPSGHLRRILLTLRKIRSNDHERLVCDLQGLRVAIIARALRITRAPATIVLLSPPIPRRFRLASWAAFGIQMLCARVLGFSCVVLSEGVAQSIRMLSLGTIRPIVSPPGVDSNHFSPRTDRIKKSQMGIPEEAFLLSYHGVLHPTRKLDSMLEWLCPAFRAERNLHLAVIGTGDDIERLKRVTRNLELDEQVHFLGGIPYNKLPRYLSATDVSLVHLPRDQEWSIPYKMLEAMACAKPVIASDVKAVTEIAAKAGCVRLVRDGPEEWSKAVLCLMTSQEEISRMSEAGRAYVRANHNWEKSVDILESALRTTV